MNDMSQRRVLISVTGPKANILKFARRWCLACSMPICCSTPWQAFSISQLNGVIHQNKRLATSPILLLNAAGGQKCHHFPAAV